MGLKLDVIHRFGSDLPMWDQWDAEGLHVFVPWAGHKLGPGDFFRAHNEHRIALTRLLGFAEVAVNGQWDARLQCAVNAGLHAAFGVLLFLFGRANLPPRWHALWFALVAALVGLPLAWQNVVSGFHSQQYFLLLLSFGAITLLPASAPWSVRWWLGAACGVLALFSMASGLLAAAAVIAVGLLAGWRHGRSALAWPTLGLCAAIGLAGWLTQVKVSYHAEFKARSLSDFLLYAMHSLQWPSLTQPWLAALLWLPFGLLLAALLRRKAAQSSFVLPVVGLGMWVLLQILASAYARGADGGMPASRYMDTLALGMLANALALGWLLDRTTGRMRWPLAALGASWLLALGFGLRVQLTPIYSYELPATHTYLANCEQITRHYLRTGNPAVLNGRDIPYPSASALRERLDIPALRVLLPVSARLPVTLEAAGGDGGFVLLDNISRRRNPSLWTSPAKDTSAFLPAGLAAPENTRLLSSRSRAAAAEWHSRPLRFARNVRLHFQISGQAPAGRTLLEFRDATTGRVVAGFTSAAPLSDETWQEIVVGVPRGNLVLHAHSAAASEWLAFTEPVEEAPVSHLATRLVASGRTLWIGAAAASVVLLGLAFWLTRTKERPAGA